MTQGKGVLPFVIETTERGDQVTARAGLPLVVETMRALRVDEAIREHVHVRERDSGYSEQEKIEAVVLSQAAGGTAVSDIGALQADAGLLRMLGCTNLPSVHALFALLYAFHDSELITKAKRERKPDQKAYIPEENAALRGLAQVNCHTVREIAKHRPCSRATLDHDATIQESHKREALPHYKGGRGYQPSAIMWAEQGLALADEYRDGNVPAGMSNLPLIKQGFTALPSCVKERFFRSDSACYERVVLKWLADPCRDGPQGTIGFAISADMSQELRAVCAAVAEEDWQLHEERVDEDVQWTEVEFTPGNWWKQASPLRYIVLRFRKRQAELFESRPERAQGNLFGEQGETSDTVAGIRYHAVVTNLTNTGDEVIRWHRKKAGTIEHIHDVTKNEIGAAIPPSGQFGANAGWYRLSMLTHNILTAMKLLALPAELHSARPKKLRHMLFAVPARLISHSGRLVVRISQDAERLCDLIAARTRLHQLATTTA